MQLIRNGIFRKLVFLLLKTTVVICGTELKITKAARQRGVKQTLTYVQFFAIQKNTLVARSQMSESNHPYQFISIIFNLHGVVVDERSGAVLIHLI